MSKKNPFAFKQTTPRGVAVWPRLNSPDMKFAKNGIGKYTCKLRVKADDPAVVKFIELLTQKRDDFLAAEVQRLKDEKKVALAIELKPGSVGFLVERDQESGEETGYLTFATSMWAGGTREDGSTWSQKPSIFDAQGNKLANPPFISGGSEVKLSLELEPYVDNKTKEVGIGRRLLAVQVLKLVSGGERTFSDLGFEAEEGDVIEDQPFNSEADQPSAGGEAHPDL